MPCAVHPLQCSHWQHEPYPPLPHEPLLHEPLPHEPYPPLPHEPYPPLPQGLCTLFPEVELTVEAVSNFDWTKLAGWGLSKNVRMWVVRLALAYLRAKGVDAKDLRSNPSTLELMRLAKTLDLTNVSSTREGGGAWEKLESPVQLRYDRNVENNTSSHTRLKVRACVSICGQRMTGFSCSSCPHVQVVAMDLFSKVYSACDVSTKLRGDGGGGGIGAYGTITCPGAFEIVSRLVPMAREELAAGRPVTLADVGVGDGRMPLCAAAHPALYDKSVRYVGFDLADATMACGLDLCDAVSRPGNTAYINEVVSKFGGEDPLSITVELFWGVLSSAEDYDRGPRVDAPRVTSLSGVTLVLAVWQGWNPNDKAEFFRLCKQALSVLGICVVQAGTAGVDPELWRDWAVQVGESLLVHTPGGTALRAFFFRRREPATPAARNTDPGLANSFLSWDHFQPPPPEIQTRSMAAAVSVV